MPFQEVHSQDSPQLQDIANILAGSKKVIVVTGAGISTNCGIPDFRSENGLYSLIQEQYDLFASQGSSRSRQPTPTVPSTPRSKHPSGFSALPSNMKGKDLFDAALWKNPTSTSVFYTFIASLRKKIRDEVEHTSITHRFIRALRDGGRLIRCYTQNIDGLEERDGFCTDMARGKGARTRFMKKVMNKPRPEGLMLPGGEMDGGCEVVELHGDLRELRCNLCQSLCSWEDDARETKLLSGEAPPCPACVAKSDERQGRGKRGTVIGSLRPNIVLYGEEHPSAQLLGPITTHDLGLAPEILLIMGTSLKVHGLKNLVKEIAKAVHARGGGKGKVIFVNLTRPAESVWGDVLDYWVGMDCDARVDDLKERRGDLWLRQGELKLPTVKATMPSNGKARQTKNCIRDNAKSAITVISMDETEKENIPLSSESQESPTSFDLKSNKRSRNPSLNVKAKASKAASGTANSQPPLPSSILSNPTGIQKLRLKPPIPRPPPNTPSRKGTSTDTPLQQLPTPPNSGRKCENGLKSAKRNHDVSFNYDEKPESTPTKRRKKDVRIWVDPVAGPNSDIAEEPLAVCNISDLAGSKRKRDKERSLKPEWTQVCTSSSRSSISAIGPSDTGNESVDKRRKIVTVEIPHRRTIEAITTAAPLKPPDQLPVTDTMNLRDLTVVFADSGLPKTEQPEELTMTLPADISWPKLNIRVALALKHTKCRAYSEAKACEVKLAQRKLPYRFNVDSRNAERLFGKCIKEDSGAEAIQLTFHA